MSWAQKPRQTEVTSFVLLAQISKQAPEARDRAEEHASRGIAEWAYSSGMASRVLSEFQREFRTSAQSAAFDSDSSVTSIEIFAFKTRETGHPRLASRAAFSNVFRSIPGTRALTAR